jgi:exosome complex RNA-binding protein Rrp42 (RNase PH superfamily)
MTTVLTTENTKFIRTSATVGLRDDGRQMLEMRQMKIIFNENSDGVEVSIGKTKVFAKISSKIIEPSSNAPNEGKMSFIINLKIMNDTKQGFTDSRGGDLSTEINKVLERTIMGSK